MRLEPLEDWTFAVNYAKELEEFPHHFMVRIGPSINASNEKFCLVVDPILKAIAEAGMRPRKDFVVSYTSGKTVFMIRDAQQALLLKLRF